MVYKRIAPEDSVVMTPMLLRTGSSVQRAVREPCQANGQFRFAQASVGARWRDGTIVPPAVRIGIMPYAVLVQLPAFIRKELSATPVLTALRSATDTVQKREAVERRLPANARRTFSDKRVPL